MAIAEALNMAVLCLRLTPKLAEVTTYIFTDSITSLDFLQRKFSDARLKEAAPEASLCT